MMKENGYINEHEKKVKSNFKTCEYNMIKVAVQIIKKSCLGENVLLTLILWLFFIP